MGKGKEAEEEWRYFMKDEQDQDIGAIFSDLFSIPESTTLGIADAIHTKNKAKKWPAFVRDEVREVENLFPFIKVIPKVEGIAHPPKPGL